MQIFRAAILNFWPCHSPWINIIMSSMLFFSRLKRILVGLLFQPGCFSTFETHECADLGVALSFSLSHTESNSSKERLYSKWLQAVNILTQSLLLFRCRLLKTAGPVVELSSCWKAVHTGHHRTNDKNNPKSTEGRHGESLVPRC